MFSLEVSVPYSLLLLFSFPHSTFVLIFLRLFFSSISICSYLSCELSFFFSPLHIRLNFLQKSLRSSHALFLCFVCPPSLSFYPVCASSWLILYSPLRACRSSFSRLSQGLPFLHPLSLPSFPLVIPSTLVNFFPFGVFFPSLLPLYVPSPHPIIPPSTVTPFGGTPYPTLSLWRRRHPHPVAALVPLECP